MKTVELKTKQKMVCQPTVTVVIKCILYINGVHNKNREIKNSTVFYKIHPFQMEKLFIILKFEYHHEKAEAHCCQIQTFSK